MGLADALSMIKFALSIIYKKKATRNTACQAGVTSPPALGATAKCPIIEQGGHHPKVPVMTYHGTLSIAFQVRVCYPCLDLYRFFAPCPYP